MGKHKSWWNKKKHYHWPPKISDLTNVSGLEIIRSDDPKKPMENLPKQTDLTDRFSSLLVQNNNTSHCPTNESSSSQDNIQTHQALSTKLSDDTLHAKLKELEEWKNHSIKQGHGKSSSCENNTVSIWRLRKFMYNLSGNSRYWYLKLREELVNLCATPLMLDQGIILQFNNDVMISITKCFVDNFM